MRVSRFYVNQPLSAAQPLNLDSEAAHYVRTVLRLKRGAEVILFNGQGFECSGTVETVDRKQVSIEIHELHLVQRESSLSISLGLCISRGERMDFAIQKAVELGVGRITPLLSKRCVVRLDDKRREQRATHWRGVIQNACEQSGRAVLPELAPIRLLEDWLSIEGPVTRLMMDPEASVGLGQITHNEHAVSLLVGPEGGLDDAELEQARQQGFVGFRLGPRILRTETAVLAGVTAIQLLWGDLGG